MRLLYGLCDVPAVSVCITFKVYWFSSQKILKRQKRLVCGEVGIGKTTTQTYEISEGP